MEVRASESACGPDPKKACVEDGSMTVEEYLRAKCDAHVKDLKGHADRLISDLKDEFERSKADIRAELEARKGVKAPYQVIILTVRSGPHKGASFRLRQQMDDQHFMLGRSTGKKFKDSGVSLPEDKEISTTHSKIIVSNNKAFYEDLSSTNGSMINGTKAPPGKQVSLSSGGTITIGGSSIDVQIEPATLEDDQ